MAYVSQNFPELEEFISYYKEEYQPRLTKTGVERPTLTSSKIGGGMSYLNKRLENMVAQSKHGNIKNYQMYTDRFKDIIKFNDRLIKKYGEDYSILKPIGSGTNTFDKYVDSKTGLIEFKTSGFGKYSSEERQEIMGRRDWLLSYWGMSDTNSKIFEAEIGAKSFDSFKHNNTYTNDVYEMFLKIFESSMWQASRKSVKYDIDEMANKIVELNKQNNGFDNILTVLTQVSNINEFFREFGI